MWWLSAASAIGSTTDRRFDAMTNEQVPEPDIARNPERSAIPGEAAGLAARDTPFDTIDNSIRNCVEAKNLGLCADTERARGMGARIIVAAEPHVCVDADIALAHEQMRIHRACRTHRCAWKAAAFQTLVQAGRVVPQSLSPRMRAAMRGIAFPALDHEPSPVGGPTSSTLREVLDRLDELVTPMPGMRGGTQEGLPNRTSSRGTYERSR
ncbi:hypothetical protein [Nocardia macrotermitis]|nr:hypothetical protein [Nocardia macrotermitis]